MRNPMDLQSILLAAANRNWELPEPGLAVLECQQPADRRQPAPDDEPNLPEGYRPIRNAIQALLMYLPGEESIAAANPPGTMKLGNQDRAQLNDSTLH